MILAKKGGPVQRGLSEKSSEICSSACLNKPEPHLFCSETGGANKWGVAPAAVLTLPLKIQICPSINKGVNERQFLASLERIDLCESGADTSYGFPGANFC